MSKVGEREWGPLVFGLVVNVRGELRRPCRVLSKGTS